MFELSAPSITVAGIFFVALEAEQVHLKAEEEEDESEVGQEVGKIALKKTSI